MKAIMLLMGLVFAAVATAQAEYVSGYTRHDGTYVQGYYRTQADNSPYNNQSYPGNYNLNTGEVTTGNQETYLNNYYKPKQSSDDSMYIPSIEKPMHATEYTNPFTWNGK